MTIPDPGPLASGAPVVFGAGAIAAIPDLVADRGAQQVLLVCGRRSFDASGAAGVLPELQRIADVHRWDDFQPNTDAGDLRRGLDLVGELRPDLVLGIGGGSAMDMAKLLCAYADLDDPGVELLDAIRSGDAIQRRDLGLILAPTTSGSGSEATHFAVVYVDEDKFSVAGDVLRPDAVVLDPSLTLSAPAYQRATSGMDAVCQAIESRWATGATATSRRHADDALGHLLPAIEGFVTDPSAATAGEMALGSHLAGRAIDVSKTTAAHALSYAITQRYGVSHGHAVALTLPHFIAAHADVPPDELQPGADLGTHREAVTAVLDHLDAPDGSAARDRFLGLMQRLGLATTLTDVGVGTAEERRALAAAVNVERLGNNPVRFTVDELLGILDTAA